MKPKEIRIGNFVNFKDREDIDYCEVTALDAGGYIHILRNFKDGEEDDQPEALEDITPIVLTEEWIQRFGFLDNDTIGVFVNGRYDIERLTSDSDEWEFCINEEQTGTTIKYVHQLQNLFHALTNKELTINISA